MDFIAYLGLFLVAGVSCYASRVGSFDCYPLHYESDSLSIDMDSCSQAWKKDSLGCWGRSKCLEFLISFFDKNQKSVDDLKVYFGGPNAIIDYDAGRKKMYIYYLSGYCEVQKNLTIVRLDDVVTLRFIVDELNDRVEECYVFSP